MYIQLIAQPDFTMHQPDQSLWINARLATCDAANPAPYGTLEGHALWLKDGRIHAVLPQAQALQAFGQAGSVHDAQGRWLTPGLVDCHTHLVYGGNRAAEWEKRLTGVPYQQIAAEGGGIISTVRATRSLDEDELALASLPRLKALMKEGVTTVEIKSGYGLTLADELKQLRAARRLAAALPVEVATTLLSAHALPPEYAGQADAYIDYVCHTIVPAAAAEGLAEAVDVFCENIAFSPAQARQVFEAARANGLAVKIHAEQLSNQHGAELAAGFGALSADHIEHLDDAGIAAMAAAGTVAVLLPGAFYFLREKQLPPVEALRRHGVPIALATDNNPGSSPLTSPLLTMNLACTLFRLTPEEALAGFTRNGARALGMQATHGTLETGKQADFALWQVQAPAELAYAMGANPCAGRIISASAG